MFFHNIKYFFKSLIKEKTLIFWTFAFPLILATFFYLTFSGIEENDVIDVINIGVVKNEEFEENLAFKEGFKELSKGEDKLLDIEYLTLEKGEELLEKGEISGIILFDNGPKTIIKKSGINETVLNYVVEEIAQSEKVFRKSIENHFEKTKEIPTEESIEKALENINEKMENLRNSENTIDKSFSNLKFSMIYFYTIIAMTCMYSGMMGMEALSKILPDTTKEGMRISVSPAPRWKLIFSGLFASFIIQILAIAILFLYTVFVLNIDYGENLGYVMILTLLGCLGGLSLGVFIETVIPLSENGKTGVLLGITMLGSFLSGMMNVGIKYYVDKHFPILNKINPTRMITDGLYSLYYYDTLERYRFNILSLVIFIAVLLGISIFRLRGRRYDSI